MFGGVFFVCIFPIIRFSYLRANAVDAHASGVWWDADAAHAAQDVSRSVLLMDAEHGNVRALALRMKAGVTLLFLTVRNANFRSLSRRERAFVAPPLCSLESRLDDGGAPSVTSKRTSVPAGGKVRWQLW